MPAFDFGQRLRDVWGKATSLLPADDLFEEELFLSSPLTTPKSKPESMPNRIAMDLPAAGATPAIDPAIHEKVSKALTALEKKKQRMKARSKINKKRKRFRNKVERKEGDQFRDGPTVRKGAKEKYHWEADLLFTSTDPAKSWVTKSAYAAVNKPGQECFEVEYELKDLVGEDSKFKFALKKWDGR